MPSGLANPERGATLVFILSLNFLQVVKQAIITSTKSELVDVMYIFKSIPVLVLQCKFLLYIKYVFF